MQSQPTAGRYNTRGLTTRMRGHFHIKLVVGTLDAIRVDVVCCYVGYVVYQGRMQHCLCCFVHHVQRILL